MSTFLCRYLLDPCALGECAGTKKGVFTITRTLGRESTAVVPGTQAAPSPNGTAALRSKSRVSTAEPLLYGIREDNISTHLLTQQPTSNKSPPFISRTRRTDWTQVTSYLISRSFITVVYSQQPIAVPPILSRSVPRACEINLAR